MKKLIGLLLTVLMVLTLSGCGNIDSIKVKLGLKNTDFEYIKQGKIRKILIQNNRDKGFSFNVTDERAISELYDILSTAKVVKEKTSLTPDYTFEMQESATKSYKFSYVAGVDKEDLGNLYSGDKVYIVSKRLDDDIIKSLWTIRKPTDFSSVYYPSIIQTLNAYITANKIKDKTMGINVTDDIDSAKFILSTDLQDFSTELSKLGSGIEVIDNNKKYDVLVNVSTQGYKQQIYKSIITFQNTKDNTTNTYYVMADYFQKWTINVKADKKPSDF